MISFSISGLVMNLPRTIVPLRWIQVKLRGFVKLKMSTATKKELGVSFGEAIMQCSSRIFCHIFSVVSLEKMCSLKKELVFIQKMLNKYANFCGSLQHNMYNISEVYFPLLLPMQ